MTLSNQAKPCVYVTASWGVHDERWVAELKDQGFQPNVYRLGIDVNEPKELVDRISREIDPHTPVLAGPLDSVTLHLVQLPHPIIGLSWGYDLHTMPDVHWLTQLDRLIVDSLATHALARSVGLDEEKITVLPWGVDLSLFSSGGSQASFEDIGIPEDSPVLLSLRAHEPKYRVADIIEGFAVIAHEYPAAHLVVGHSGSLSTELKELAQQRGVDDRTHFIGTIAESKLPALLRRSTLYISASEVDGSSVTLLQAMACGVPAVTSNTPGNLGWIAHGETGWVFDCGSPTALAQQLRTALSMEPEERATIITNAHRKVKSEANWDRNRGLLARALQLR